MYEFNLDLPESKRWDAILEDYRDKLRAFRANIIDLVAPFSGDSFSIKSSIFLFDKLGQIWFSGEIKKICEALDIDFYVGVMLQLFFDVYSGCTAVTTEVSGRKVLFRVMDWPLSFLKDLTVNLKVTKNKRVLYYATTWVGYVGVLTSMKPGMNAVAVNSRGVIDGSLYDYVKSQGMSLINKTQVGLALRYANEQYRDEVDFLRYLRNVKTTSPCYFTVCSCDRVNRTIVRDCSSVEIIESDRIITTNIGANGENIALSKERAEVVSSVLRDTVFATVDDVFDKLLVSPILNDESIYVCCLDPGCPERSITRIL
jgi:hypothetical protein